MNDLLLVIDMQNVYLPDQPWACETVAHTKANILKLLEKHPKNQTIFTRYIAAEHPVGTWKTYNEADRIILTGVVSECCVLSTFFEGIDLGCKLIWLTDATSGLNPILEAETLHILQGLSPLHVEFMTTEEYLTQQS